MEFIIPKQTAAATSQRYFTRGSLPQTVQVAGDILTSTVAVNVMDGIGGVLPLYNDVGVAVVLSATSQPLKIDSPIALQFVKGVTANACGLQLFE